MAKRAGRERGAVEERRRTAREGGADAERVERERAGGEGEERKTQKERQALARKSLEEKKKDDDEDDEQDDEQDDEENISFWRRADLPGRAPSCFTSPPVMGFTSSILIRFLLDCMGVRWGLDGHAASKSE